MPVYQYNALTGEGRATAGTVTADDRAAALASVEAMGLYPTRLDENGHAAPLPSRASGQAVIGRAMRVRPAQTLAFIRQLANLLAAGVSLSRALRILSRESAHPGAKAMWQSIHDRVADGDALADALRHHPQVFPAVHVAMVRAGEAGGFLDVVLRQIADFMARERELKSKMLSAMIYPCVLAVIATGVVIFLLAWFIPRFSEIFEQFGESLPLLTRIVQAASTMVLHYGLFVLVGGVILALVGHRALSSDAGRRWSDRQILRLPGIGAAAAQFALVRFARMLGTLIGAGVPLLGALRVAREAVGNQTLADTLTSAIEQVKQGHPLARSLAQCPQLFSASIIEMIAVAEESGRLDSELVRMADECESDLDRRLRVLVSLAEPALLLVMAALVGTIVIGMLLPVFGLWDAIK
ncbi:MAG: type II secretion system F family protein [Phycisphaeraceae bacterium]